LRNSLNVALPVTANFIDPSRSGAHANQPVRLAGYPREGCGSGAIFTNAKGSRVVELTLSAGAGRAITTFPGSLGGGCPSICASDDRAERRAFGCPHLLMGSGHSVRCGRDKLFRTLIFRPREHRAHSSVGPRQGPPFPCHTFARHFLSDIFGPVADLPHIEGIRGTPAFVFLTCVV
jgi:hypothetical protein